MTEKDNTDWSLTESIRNASSPERPNVARRLDGGELVPTEISNVPTAPIITLPDSNASLGILAQWQANTLSRKVALQQLQVRYDAELDLLKFQLGKAVLMRKAEADVVAKEYLKELDSRQLEILARMGLRNKETRERALFDLTEMTATKLKEVQKADWPPELKTDTINQLFVLRARYVTEMMEELGNYPGD